MLELTKLTVGTDTELFLIDKATGAFRSAIGLIGGKKGSPKDIGKCCGLEEDNVSCELTVPPVLLIGGADEMWENLEFVMKTIKSSIPKELDVKCCPSALFDESELTHPKAKEFGCDPDFNAWKGGELNPKPDSNGNLRSCGKNVCHLN